MIAERFETLERRSLDARLVELEGERALAGDKLRQLMRLHVAFADIARADGAGGVEAATLRAACDALGFGRAMVLRSCDGAVVVAACRDGGEPLEIQGTRGSAGHDVDGVAMPKELSESLRGDATTPAPDGALRPVWTGEATSATGRANDLDAPLVDIRRWYVATSFGTPGRAGILLADGHGLADVAAWECALFETVGAIATIALANATLLAETRDLALRDPLTGLFNRRAFADRLRQEIDYSRRARRSCALAVIDVDDFKRVNDDFGHAHGDAVLRRVAATLLCEQRAHDVVGRFAGDEFVAAFVDVDPALARGLVGRLSRRLRAEGLRCSLGAALFPRDADDAEDLFRRADAALYAAKRAGKDRYAFA